MYKVSREQRKSFDRLPVGKRKEIIKFYGSVNKAFESGLKIEGKRARHVQSFGEDEASFDMMLNPDNYIDQFRK
jgi:hypothetical protein